MTYGMTENGIVIKTLDQIKEEHEAKWKSAFGESFDLSAESPAGQMIAFTAESEFEIWELVEDVVNQLNPMTATGVMLDLCCALVGVKRELSKPSYLYGQAFFGTEGTVIPAGTELSVPADSTKVYATENDITIGAGVDEIHNLQFSVLPTSGTFRLKINAELTDEIDITSSVEEMAEVVNGLMAIEECEVTQVSNYNYLFNLGKVEVETFVIYSNDVVDSQGNGVTLTSTQTSTGEYQATGNLVATENGAKTAFSYSLTAINNPVTGLTRTFNPEDSTAGADVETDEQLRIRRDKSLSIGKATPEAIRTALLNGVPNLDDVKVVENVEDIADSVGRPPHSFETYVTYQSVSDDDIANIHELIKEYKGAGIRAYGKNVKTITDVDGQPRDIGYSVPENVNIYLDVDISVTSDYPSNGDTLLKQAIVEWGNDLGVGKSVIVFPELMRAFDIDGIYDVNVRIGKSADPTSDNNILIGNGVDSEVEVSKWDTSRIFINHI